MNIEDLNTIFPLKGAMLAKATKQVIEEGTNVPGTVAAVINLGQAKDIIQALKDVEDMYNKESLGVHMYTDEFGKMFDRIIFFHEVFEWCMGKLKD